MDEIEKEKRWWVEHIDDESELKKPCRSYYEYSRWRKTFGLIIDLFKAT